MSSNPGWKLNGKNTAAVVQALRALDKATLGDNMTRLGKAFGVTGGATQAQGVVEAAATGFQAGEWKPFLLEMESAVVGKIARSAAGAMLGITLGLLGGRVAWRWSSGVCWLAWPVPTSTRRKLIRSTTG